MVVRFLRFAVPLAILLVLIPESASASGDRLPPPVITSPTAAAIVERAGNLVVSGTGSPGQTVYVNLYSTYAAYEANNAAAEKSYQEFEKTHNLGASGGPPGSIVAADGQWTDTVDRSLITQAERDGVFYVTAHQATRVSLGPDTYPVSANSAAVLVRLSWLGQPPVPRFVGLGSPATIHRVSNGSIVLHGTGVPGAVLLGFVDSSRSGVSADLGRFRQQEETLGTACPTGNAFCSTVTVAHNGTWDFTVDATTARSGTLVVAAAQAVNNGSNNRWSAATMPQSIAVETDVAGLATASSPSVFSQLVAFNWATFTPAHVALTAGAALVLTLLLGFPTSLLNSALEDSYDERARRLKPITDRLVRLGKRISAGWKRATVRLPKILVTILWFLVAAIISGFADPAFGFNLGSLRLLLSLFVAFGLLNVLGAYVTWWATASSTHTKRPTFPSRPSNLVILAVTVLVARLIHLEPAIVFGTVLGLDFGVKLAVNRKVRVILIGAAYAAVVGIIAWLAYSALPASSTALGPVVLREFFSQLAVAGIATLPVTLLPFQALNGETVFRWRRVIWAASYAIGLALFLLILLPMPFSWAGVNEALVAWICLFVAYSIVAILVWFSVRYHWFRERKHHNPAAKV